MVLQVYFFYFFREKIYFLLVSFLLQTGQESFFFLLDRSATEPDLSEAYPELAEEGKFLLDFIKVFKPGRMGEVSCLRQ